MRQAAETQSTAEGWLLGTNKGREPQRNDLGNSARRNSQFKVWLRIDGKAWMHAVCTDRSGFKSLQPTTPAPTVVSSAEHRTSKPLPGSSGSESRTKTFFPLNGA